MTVNKRLEPIPAHFWCSETGNEPVRDWLRSLSKEERSIIGHDLRTLQFGWPVGMPLNKPLGDGLHEMRSTLPGNRIARLLSTHFEGRLIILHGFIKKSQKLPKSDLELAKRRKKALESTS